MAALVAPTYQVSRTGMHKPDICPVKWRFVDSGVEHDNADAQPSLCTSPAIPHGLALSIEVKRRIGRGEHGTFRVVALSRGICGPLRRGRDARGRDRTQSRIERSPDGIAAVCHRALSTRRGFLGSILPSVVNQKRD